MQRKKSSNKGKYYQKWLLNIAIVCIAVVVVGFVISAGRRLVNQEKRIDLNRTEVIEEDYTPVMIEVLNGCGESGLAGKFSNYLRKKGIDVSYTGNAQSMDHEESYLIKRIQNENKLQSLNKILNFSQSRIRSKDSALPHTDFSLIIGKDYKELELYKQIKKSGDKLSTK